MGVFGGGVVGLAAARGCGGGELCRLSTRTSSQHELLDFPLKGAYLSRPYRKNQGERLQIFWLAAITAPIEQLFERLFCVSGAMFQAIYFSWWHFLFIYISIFSNQVKETNARSEWIYLKGSVSVPRSRGVGRANIH